MSSSDDRRVASLGGGPHSSNPIGIEGKGGEGKQSYSGSRKQHHLLLLEDLQFQELLEHPPALTIVLSILDLMPTTFMPIFFICDALCR